MTVIENEKCGIRGPHMVVLLKVPHGRTLASSHTHPVPGPHCSDPRSFSIHPLPFLPTRQLPCMPPFPLPSSPHCSASQPCSLPSPLLPHPPACPSAVLLSPLLCFPPLQPTPPHLPPHPLGLHPFSFLPPPSLYRTCLWLAIHQVLNSSMPTPPLPSVFTSWKMPLASASSNPEVWKQRCGTNTHISTQS